MACCVQVQSQSLPFGVLKCEGPVPTAFSKRSSEKALQNVSNIERANQSKKEITEEQEFAMVSTFVIDEILRSGKVLYGDTVTQYIQKVANQLLADQPEILSQLNFFTLKSNLVNAISTHQGYIFVTTGLLARIKNESELAFILAHEISHFTQKHNLSSAKLRNRLLDENQDGNFEDRVKTIYQYSRENEMEADELGMKLYLSAGYVFDFGLDALAMLEHADESFVHSHIGPNHFESTNWKVGYGSSGTSTTDNNLKTNSGKMNKQAQFLWPTTFPEMPAQTEVDATFKTHPDVVDRLRRVEEIFASEFDKELSTKDFIATSKSYFEHIQQRAWVEDIVANIRQANFVDVIYLAQGLDSLMPNQSFSADAKAMAWYGLAHHVSGGEDMNAFGLHDDLKFLSNKQLLPLNHVIRSMNKDQLMIMAVRNIALAIAQKGNTPFRRNLLDSSIKIMLSNPTFEMYQYSVGAMDTATNGTAYWHKALMGLNLLENSGYAHFKRLRMKDSLVLQVEEGKEKQKMNALKKMGVGHRDYMAVQSLGIDSLWMFSPDYDQIEQAGSGKVTRNYVRDEAIATTFEDDYAAAASANQMHLQFLKNMGSATLTTDDVNRFAMMQDWMEERLNNGLTPMMLFQTALMKSELKENNIGHVAWAGAVNHIESRKFSPLYMVVSMIYIPAFPYYVYWQITKAKKFQFVVLVFNAETGEMDGMFAQKFTADWSRDFLRSHLFDIMHQIKTPPKSKKTGRAAL